MAVRCIKELYHCKNTESVCTKAQKTEKQSSLCKVQKLLKLSKKQAFPCGRACFIISYIY